MKRSLKRTLCMICVICMLASNFGGLGFGVFARREPVVLTQELKASDDKTYEITVTYEIELEEDEEPPEEPTLVVREIVAPEPEPTADEPDDAAGPEDIAMPADDDAPADDTASADDTLPADDIASADDTIPADDTLPVDDTASADDTAPADDTASVDDTASADDAASVDDAASADDTIPADDTLPVDDAASADDTIPADDAAEPEYSFTYDEYVEKAAKALDCEVWDVTGARVFDISLRDPVTGEELQPEGPVSVSIRLLEDSFREEASVGVVHFSDDEEEDPEVMASAVTDEADAVEFETESFSVYVVIEHEGSQIVTTPRVEFHFLAQDFAEQTDVSSGSPVYYYTASPFNFYNKNNELQTTQILTAGESLEMIANPPNIEEIEYELTDDTLIDSQKTYYTYDAGTDAYTAVASPDAGDLASYYEKISTEEFFYGWYVVNLRGEDPTVRNAETGKWTGTIAYEWTAAPDKISFEKPMTLAGSGERHVGDTLTWTIDGVTYSGTLDREGVVHVYLAPIYEDFYFVNYRMGPWDYGENASLLTLANSLLTRRLVVFGSSATKEVRIGNVMGPSPDPQHQVFVGWQEYGKALNDFYETVDLANSTADATVENNSPGHTDGYWITITKVPGQSYYDLYPVFAEARWLYYDLGRSGNGAEYVPAAYLLSNDAEGAGTYLTKLAVSSRPGYDFVGWYTARDEDYNGTDTQLTDEHGDFRDEVKDKAFYGVYGTQTVGGKEVKVLTDLTMISIGAAAPAGYDKLFEIRSDGKLYFYKDLDALTVYAKWNPTPVKYNVVFWLQNANDDEYSMTGYRQLNAIAGDTVKISTSGNNGRTVSVDAPGTIYDATITLQNTQETETVGGQTVKRGDYIKELNYVHYATYDGMDGSTNKGVEIEGDGSTIVNVYYDRNLYTLRFDIGYSSTSGGGTTTDYVATEPSGFAPGDTVYGYVDGGLVTLTSDGNGGWIYDGGDTNVAYGLVGGKYVPLTPGEVTTEQLYKPYVFTQTNANANDGLYGVSGSEYVPLVGTTVDGYTYTADYTYTSTTATTGTLYGIDAGGNYVQLTPATRYRQTSTLANGNYLIVSANAAGTGYALGHNNDNIAVDTVTIYTEGANRYINSDTVDGTSVWTVSNTYRFTNNGYRLGRTGNNNFTLAVNTTISNNNRTWTWDGNNNRLYQSSGNTNYNIRYYNNAFSMNTAANSVYLYVAETYFTLGGEPYTGTRYTRANNGSTDVSSEASLNVPGLYYVDGNSGKVSVTAHPSTVWSYTLSGAAYANTQPRYTRADYSGSDRYTASQLTDNGGTYYYADTTGKYGPVGMNVPMQAAETETAVHSWTYGGETYGDTIYMYTPYTGTLYKQVTGSGTTTYYVSYINNQDNYNDFLTGSRVNLGTTIPTDFIPCGRYTQTAGGTTYTIYYYDLTAKYGETIADRWPDTQPGRTNTSNTDYGFIGWIPLRQSYYHDFYNTSSSIKGDYETMSEYIIGVGSSPYTFTTADQGVAHELRCRYQSNVNRYVYRAYFWDPTLPGDGFPDTPDVEMKVNSAGDPRYRAVSTYYGYYSESDEVVVRLVRGNENGNEVDLPSTSNEGYSSYYVTSVGYNAMIINFYYRPHEHTLTFKNADGTVLGVQNYYYDQALTTPDLYTATAVANTPEGHEFAGWFENNEGVGVPFNFNTKMPDGNIALYAIYTPIKYRVIIDPNGAEIDHIDHTGAAYVVGGVSYATPLNRGDLNYSVGEASFTRPADSGYNKSQATYFNGRYGELVGEYAVSRNYVPISDAAANYYEGELFYYVYMPYYYDYPLPSDCRDALYVTSDGSKTATDELYQLYLFYYDWTMACLESGDISGVSYGDPAEALDYDSWKNMYVTKQEGSTSKFQLYRRLNANEHYEFLGWYKVTFDTNGVETGVESMPYNFSDPVEGPMTLRAMWRLDGGYKIQYHADCYVAEGTINAEIENYLDPKVGASTLSYTDGATTTVFKMPYNISLNGQLTEDYIFRGYRLVNVHYVGSSLEPSYTALEPGVYYDPGDAFTVNADYADPSGYLHLQAYYEIRDSAYRRPEIANLTLDANGGYLTDGTGYVNAVWHDGTELAQNVNLTDAVGWKGVGVVSATAYDTDGTTPLQYPFIEFGDIQSNVGVNLYRFASSIDRVGGNDDGDALTPPGTNYFSHPENYFLLGFDDARDENDFIATYPADSIVSVKRTDDETIYAVWEPMIYLNFQNKTESDISFSLSSDSALAMYITNEVTGLYDRVKVDDPNNITVQAGKTLHLALPLAEEKTITVSGSNDLGVGKILTWDTSLTVDGFEYTTIHEEGGTISHPDVTYNHIHGGEACSHALAHGEVNSTDKDYSFEEKLLFNEGGITVIFDDGAVDYALVLDDNYPGGGTQEYDYSSEYVAAGHSQLLPSTSTRMGYQLLGWAYTAGATTPDYSTASNDWTIADLDDFFNNNASVQKTSINDGDTLQATLYAVWTVNNEASTVYVYNNVPAPGNQSAEFEYTLNLAAKYRANNYADQNVSLSRTFSLAHGEYAVLVSSNTTTTADIRTTVTVYQANGVVKKDDSDNDMIYVVSWTGTPHPGGGFEDVDIRVTETPAQYYDTSVERTAQSTNGFSLYLGDDTTGAVTQAASNVVHWAYTDAGGTIVFTNTRQTHDVTLVKTETSNTTIPGTFQFNVSYVLDGDTAHPYTVSGVKVTSGTPNTSALADTPPGLFGMPAGAELTISEVNDGSYDTRVKVDGGAWAQSTEVTLTVDSDKTVYYDNTLKSYHVSFVKVDQNMSQNVNVMFDFAGATISHTNLRSRVGDGKFFEDDLWVGSYTLTEKFQPEGYRGLSAPVAVTVDGSAAEGLNVSCGSDHVKVEYNPTTKAYTVYVVNQQIVNYTVAKVLEDPLVSQRDFTFTATYTYTLLGATTTESESVTIASGGSATVSVPVGASLTISEGGGGSGNPIYNTYDTTYKVDAGAYLDGAENRSYTNTSVTAGETVTFKNTRKTVDITVTKTVESGDTELDFSFTAAVTNGANPVKNLTVYDDADDAKDLATDASGKVAFTLRDGGSQVLTIPIGANLRVGETADPDYTTSIDGEEISTTDADGCYSKAYAIDSSSAGLIVAFVNTSGGVDVSFVKRDSYGAAMGGVSFTLVDQSDASKIYTAVSSSDAADKGTVSFEKIPGGVYTLTEDAGSYLDKNGAPCASSLSYVLVVGDAELAKVGTPGAVLANVSAAQLEAQTGSGAGANKYAVFLYKNGLAYAAGQDDDAADIAAFGVMNRSLKTRRVILRKTDDSFNTTPGAVFDLLRWDLSKARGCTSSYDANGDGTDDGAACLYSGELPFGTYFLHETTLPSGAVSSESAGGDGSWWFVLKVEAAGASFVKNTDGSTRFATRAAAIAAAAPTA